MTTATEIPDLTSLQQNQPQEASQNQPPEPETRSSLNGDHFKDFDAGQELPDDSAAAVDGFMNKDQFFQFFAALHTIPGQMMAVRTLIEAPAKPEARPACDAIYDTAREVPSLHFLIKPGSVWMQRGMVVLAYAVPVAIGVKAELAARAPIERELDQEVLLQPEPAQPVQNDSNLKVDDAVKEPATKRRGAAVVPQK